MIFFFFCEKFKPADFTRILPANCYFDTRPLRTWTMLFGSLHFFTKSKTVQLLGFSAPWQMCRRRTSKTDLNVSFFWNIFVQKSLKHQNKAFWEVLSRFRVKDSEKVEASTKMFFFGVLPWRSVFLCHWKKKGSKQNKNASKSQRQPPKNW